MSAVGDVKIPTVITAQVAAPSSNNLTLAAGSASDYVLHNNPILINMNATEPRLEIGSGNQLGPLFAYVTATDQYFNTTLPGDCAISAGGSVYIGTTNSTTPQIGIAYNGGPTFNGTITCNNVANDNTQNDLVAINGSNQLVYRTASTITNNPFNQSLNTTNSPTFAGLTTPSVTAASGNLTLAAGAVGNYVELSESCIVSPNATAPRYEIGNGSAQGSLFAEAVSNGQYFTSSLIGDTCIRNSTLGGIGIGTSTGVPQIYLLNSNITFNSVINDNTQNNLLAINGSNQLVYRTVSTVNPFNQSLNTTNSPTFVGVTSNSVTSAASTPLTLAVTTAGQLISIAAPAYFNTTGITNPYFALNSSGASTGICIGMASATNAFFTGAVSPDMCVRNTTGRILLGTSTGTPQIVINGTTGVTINGGATMLNSVTNTNTATEILALNGSNVIVYRSIPATPTTLLSTYQLTGFQTINNNVNTSVNFPAGQITNNIGFTYTGNTFNIPINGVYLLEWNAYWTTGIGGAPMYTYLTTTGSDIYGNELGSFTNSNGASQHSSVIISLTTSQSFQIIVYQNSGSGLTLQGTGVFSSRLNVLLMQSF